MKQYTFCRLYPAEIEAVWGLFQRTPEFDGFISRETFNVLLEQGLLQLWAEPDALTPVAVMVTEIQPREGGGFVNVLTLVSKDTVGQLELFERIKVWARKNGCVKIRAICKDAQMRLFARNGFAKYANAIELELNDA